ncbi:MAG: hypothetical protein ACP5OG_00475 [Candidatus Nanoarchaeia archaeon]
MEKRGKSKEKIPFYKKDLDIYSVLAIIIIPIAIITIVIVAKIILNGKEIDKNSREYKLKECIENQNYSNLCQNYLSEYLSENECSSLGKLSDRCYLRIADNGMLNLCDKIKDEDLRADCRLRNEIMIESQEMK